MMTKGCVCLAMVLPGGHEDFPKDKGGEVSSDLNRSKITR